MKPSEMGHPVVPTLKLGWNLFGGVCVYGSMQRSRMRVAWFVLLAVLLGGGSLGAQAAAAKRMAPEAVPVFDVATIRLSDPDSKRQGINSDGNRMHLQGQTLTSMMMFAYSLHKNQIVEGPGWRSADKYEVEGVLSAQGEPDLKQMQGALRQLIVDRFGLKMHRERREMAYYAIVVGKGGSKLVKAATGDEGEPDQSGDGGRGGMTMHYTANTLSDFALGMQYFADRPVVDETGLSGRYDFTLKWLPETMSAPEADAAPGLFTAMQEQLGLKLEPKRGGVEVLVIDGLARPSAN